MASVWYQAILISLNIKYQILNLYLPKPKKYVSLNLSYNKVMLLKETIIGNERAGEILEKGFKSDKLSHAYLFTGPEHLGKKTLALNFCRLLLQDGSTALRDNG